MRNYRTYLILCLILLPVALFFSFCKPWTVTGDIWETAAAIRAVSDNVLSPSNPLLELPGNTSPRFTPYTIFWGIAMKLTGLGLFTIVGIAGIVNYVLFVTGLSRFTRKHFQDNTLPTYILLTMLVVWGRGFDVVNAYQFTLFFLTLPLVGLFTYGICFHALAALHVFLNNRRWHGLLLYVLLSIIAFITHPITAAFGFVAAIAILLAETNLKKALLFQAIPLLALGAALMWPYFDYATVLIKGSTGVWYKTPLFSGQLQALGAAIIGFPIVLYYGLKRQHLFLAYGLSFCVLIYIACWAAEIQIGGRFIYFTAIFLHLAIARYLSEHRLLRWDGLRASLHNNRLAFALLLILVVPSLFCQVRELKWSLTEIYTPPFRFHTQNYPSQPFFFLTDYLGPSDVVMAEDITGWVVPAITGAKLVTTLKGNPLMEAEIFQRRNKATTFFIEALSLEKRRALLKEYHATHILLDASRVAKWDSSFVRDLPLLGRKEIERGAIVLYKTQDEINP
ncbi:hypothetical protein KKG05_08685 [bacterium]|nr:hypothetical protein [bacterium]